MKKTMKLNRGLILMVFVIVLVLGVTGIIYASSNGHADDLRNMCKGVYAAMDETLLALNPETADLASMEAAQKAFTEKVSGMVAADNTVSDSFRAILTDVYEKQTYATALQHTNYDFTKIDIDDGKATVTFEVSADITFPDSGSRTDSLRGTAGFVLEGGQWKMAYISMFPINRTPFYYY